MAEPLWVRVAGLPAKVKIAATAAMIAGYLALVFAGGATYGRSLRPINLGLVVVFGVLFGLRRATLLGAGLALLNVAVYSALGIMAPDSATLASNVLAAVFGVFVGAMVGKGRDLALALREEVKLRKQAEQRKRELSALIVHDLKSPLTGILGNAELMADPTMSDEDRAACARDIRSAADAMNRMVMNLLDVARAEDGLLELHVQPVDLGALAHVAKAWVDKSEHPVEVITNGPSTAVVDGELIRRVLVNLLDNAVKYTPRGKPIRVEVHDAGDELELSVRDEGPGIPVEYAQRIFDQYVRLDRDAPVAAHRSRGLGLAFCKLAAQAHGGRIWVEPNQPEGSVFKVRLPRARN